MLIIYFAFPLPMPGFIPEVQLTRIILSDKIRPLSKIEKRRHEKNDNHQFIPKCPFERASRRWNLATILFVSFDSSNRRHASQSCGF